MKFSTREEYGLRAMVELARSYGEGPVSLAEVCRIESMSLSYLEQVIPSLRRAGLLESSRGAYGGYQLTREPGQITAGDIIRAVEGTIVQVPCLSAHTETRCAREGQCPTSNVWVEVGRKLIDTLDSMTLAGLIEADSPATCCSSLPEDGEINQGELHHERHVG
jgi:Rrf2 family transcriptional regulator, cysteine metabolism repressor